MPSNESDQPDDLERAEREAAADRAAAEASALIAAMYALEKAGRPLTRRQRDEREKAARWARYLQAQAERGGH